MLKTINVLGKEMLYVAKKHTAYPPVYSLFIGKEEDKTNIYIYIYMCVCVCARARAYMTTQQRNTRERCVTIERTIQMLKLLKD